MQNLAATGDYLFYGIIALVIVLIIAAIIAAVAIAKRKRNNDSGNHGNHSGAHHAGTSDAERGSHAQHIDSGDSSK